MTSNHQIYNFEKSRERIDEILKTNDLSFEELNSIPSRDRLTYSNGFYVKCTALFVDIRNSTNLSSKYKRPTLARIYKSYISEVVAIINDNTNCAEIFIEGDCVWSIFDTKLKIDMDSVFKTAAQISSIIDVLNCKMKKKNIDPIDIGMGIDYGRALMVKAGYNGSGINDIVWMGDVVGSAAKMSNYGNKGLFDYELMVSLDFYNNLNDHNKKLLNWNNSRECYHGNVVNSSMENWKKSNCS